MQDLKFTIENVLALILIVSLIVLTFVLVFVKPPESDVFKVLVGALLTVGFASVIAFYYGSSTGSKAKDDAMTKVLNSNPPSEPPHA